MTHVGLHVMCPLLLSDFNKYLIVSINSLNDSLVVTCGQTAMVHSFTPREESPVLIGWERLGDPLWKMDIRERSLFFAKDLSREFESKSTVCILRN